MTFEELEYSNKHFAAKCDAYEKSLNQIKHLLGIKPKGYFEAIVSSIENDVKEIENESVIILDGIKKLKQDSYYLQSILVRKWWKLK